MPHDVLTFLGCLFIIIGLFISRAMMSIGMMVLIGNAIFNLKLTEHFRTFIHKPYLILLTGYFFIHLLSYFWSDNTQYFVERMQIMTPFLILPFAFHSMNQLDRKWIDIELAIFVLFVVLGMSWSLFQYAQQKEIFDAGYGLSKVLPTPFKNDHIRFSLAVTLSISFSVYFISRYSNKIILIFSAFAIIYAIIYLHILAAKSGLLAFYMISFLFLIKLVLKKKYRVHASILLFSLIAIPVIMYYTSSSFKNKLYYIQYSIYQMMNDEKESNISDEGRLISYNYAFQSIKKNLWIGVGLGDVKDEMQKYYDKDFGESKVIALLPHNQFLMNGMAIGLLGILYLASLQIAILRQCFKRDFLSFLFWCIFFLALLIEPLYETQYGTCMFLFFLLLLLQRRIKTE